MTMCGGSGRSALVVAAAALALALLVAPTAAQPVGPALQYRTTISSGASSVQTATSRETHLLSVLFTLGPCSALQPHVHNGSELSQAVKGTSYLGFIDTNNNLTSVALSPGDLFELPLAKMHFYYNPSCERVQFLGIFPAYTTTQFIFPAVAAIPPHISTTFYLLGSPPTPRSFPFATNAECYSNCSSTTGSSDAWWASVQPGASGAGTPPVQAQTGR